MSRAAESTPDFALLAREAGRCGWKPASAGPLEGDLIFQTGAGARRAHARLFHSERGEQALLAIDLGDHPLRGREELFPRFLDFPMEARMAIGAAGLLAAAGNVLLSAEGRIDLYRLPEETLECRATTAREFEEELLPALVARARQKGSALGSLPNAMEAAQALRGWTAHWSRQLAARLEAPEADCEKFIWKLLLMLQVARKTGKSEMLGGWGLACEQLGADWTLSYDSLSTHADLGRALEEFDSAFSSRIFSGDAEMHKDWLAALEETTLAEQLRAEMLMHAQFKFEPETVAWISADLESEQAGWRREVAGLPPVRKRLSAAGWSVLEPIVCDVAAHGVGSALRELDRLAEFWMGMDLMAREREPRDEAAYAQLDLFRGAPRGVSPMNELDDGINFLLSESIRLAGVAPEREFGVGIVFLLKALGLAQKMDWPFLGIDTLDRLWLAPES